MSFNLVSNIEYCSTLIHESYPLSLIYYSHLTSAFVALIVGFFVFMKNRQAFAGKILFSLALSFSVWVFFNLILWTSSDSSKIMFFWSLSGLLIMLMFSLSLYLTYVFIDKKDVDLSKKLLIGALFLPIILLTPTNFNLENFSILNDCEATEGVYFTSYYYLFGLLTFLWILALSISRYRKADDHFRKQIVLFSFGIEFFILSFFASGYLASLLDYYELEFYGISSMAVFMAFLAYLIVKFKAFDIKLLGTQALVIILMILVGSQFFYVKTQTNFILTIVTFLLVVSVGILLIRSFKRSEERKEELQYMADRLAESNDRLRELDNTKTEFISIASHQLRTPLTAIKGYCALLIDGSYGSITKEIEEVLHRIILSNDRLVNLVENLLNVSRMEAGRMEYKFEDHHVEQLLSELYDSFDMSARSKNLTLIFDLPKDPLPALPLDKQKMQEVFSNLIDNAIKYTNAGDVKVTVRQNPENHKTTIIIKDSGIGIPKEEIPFLFAKFSRGRDVNRLHANGTGLGLYVAKNIIDAHKGTIHIESEGEGKGTAFVVELG